MSYLTRTNAGNGQAGSANVQTVNFSVFVLKLTLNSLLSFVSGEMEGVSYIHEGYPVISRYRSLCKATNWQDHENNSKTKDSGHDSIVFSGGTNTSVLKSYPLSLREEALGLQVDRRLHKSNNNVTRESDATETHSKVTETYSKSDTKAIETVSKAMETNLKATQTDLKTTETDSNAIETDSKAMETNLKATKTDLQATETDSNLKETDLNC